MNRVKDANSLIDEMSDELTGATAVFDCTPEITYPSLLLYYEVYSNYLILLCINLFLPTLR